MKSLQLFIFITIAICSASCLMNSNDNNNQSENNFKILQFEQKKFASINLKENCFDLYYDDKLDRIVFLSKENVFLLHTHDYSIDQKICLDRTLVKWNPTGVFIHSLDSIFLFFEKDTQILALINSNGNVLDNYSLKDDNSSFKNPPSIFFRQLNKPIIINDKLYLSGYSMGEVSGEKLADRPVCLEIDLKTKGINHLIQYPNEYESDNWGGTYYRFCYSTPNHKNELIYSFPASHKLQVYDIQSGTLKTINARSRKVKVINPLKEISKIELDLEKHSNQIVSHFYTQDSYSHILFDPYKKCYYRFVHHSAKVSFKGSFYDKNVYSIIVLNEDLEYVGEVIMSDKNISPHLAFVTPEGLHLSYKTNSTGMAHIILIEIN